MLLQELNKKYSFSKLQNLLLIFAFVFVSGCFFKNDKVEVKPEEDKGPPPVVVTDPTPMPKPPQPGPAPVPAPEPLPVPTKPAFKCESKKDYGDYKCAGKFRATTQAELSDYLKNFGLEKNKYKDLEIAFSLSGDDLQIHSPCNINLQNDVTIGPLIYALMVVVVLEMRGMGAIILMTMIMNMRKKIT